MSRQGRDTIKYEKRTRRGINPIFALSQPGKEVNKNDLLQTLDEIVGSPFYSVFLIFFRVGMFDVSRSGGGSCESYTGSGSDYPPSGCGYKKIESAIKGRRISDRPGRGRDRKRPKAATNIAEF